jgi:exopolysaccharide production protein ExoQ
MRIHNGHVLGAAALIVPPVSVLIPLLSTSFLGLTALAALAVLWREGRLAALKPGAAAWAVIALAVAAIASLAWTMDTAVTLDKAPRMIALFAAGLVIIGAAGALDEAAHRTFCRLAVAGIVVALALLLFEWLTTGFFVGVGGKHFDDEHVMFVSYNRGLTLISLTIWSVGLILWRRSPMWFWALMAAALGLNMVFTSGAATTGLLIGVVAFLIAHKAPRRTATVFASLAVLYIAVSPFVHAWVLSPKVFPINRVEMEKKYGYFPRSAYHRILIWNFSSEKALERPVLGWGFHTSRVVPGGGTHLDTSEQSLPLHPHNGVVQVWLELGALGAAIIVAMIATAVGRIRRWPIGDGATEIALAGFAGGYTMICISYGLWQSWWLASMFYGVAFLIAARGPSDAGAAPG